MINFMVEFAKETIEDMRKKYKEIKTVENKLLGVQVKNQPYYIICLLFSNILMLTLRKTV
jgi:hypothetical protein